VKITWAPILALVALLVLAGLFGYELGGAYVDHIMP
jgi:hypothetical protein